MTIIDDIINLICSPAALGDAIAGWFGDKSSTANSQCHTLVLWAIIILLVLIAFWIAGIIFGCLKNFTGILVDLGILHPRGSMYQGVPRGREAREHAVRNYKPQDPSERSGAKRVMDRIRQRKGERVRRELTDTDKNK